MLRPWDVSVMFVLTQILQFLLLIVVSLGLVHCRIGPFGVRIVLLRLSRSRWWGISGLGELFRCSMYMVQSLRILFGFLFLVDARLTDFDLDSLLNGLTLMESILGFVMYDDPLYMCLCFARFADFGLIVNHVVDFFRDMVYLLGLIDFLDFLCQFDLLVVGARIADMFVLSAGLLIQLVVTLFLELVWR